MNPRQNAASWSDNSGNFSNDHRNNIRNRQNRRRRRQERSPSRENRERSREQSPVIVRLNASFQEPPFEEFWNNEQAERAQREWRQNEEDQVRMINNLNGELRMEARIRRNLHLKVNSFIALLPLLKRNEKEMCTICQEVFDKDERVLLECNHLFHPVCLKNYFNDLAEFPIEPVSGRFREMTCPLCKENYTDKIKLINEDPVIAQKMRERKADYEREDEEIRRIENEQEEGEINEEEAEELKIRREEDEKIKKLLEEISNIKDTQKKREDKKKEKVMQEIEKLEAKKRNTEKEIEIMKNEIKEIEEKIAAKKFDVTKVNVTIRELRKKLT